MIILYQPDIDVHKFNVINLPTNRKDVNTIILMIVANVHKNKPLNIQLATSYCDAMQYNACMYINILVVDIILVIMLNTFLNNDV